MKKVIVLIVVSILIGIISTAAAPLPAPIQTLQGPLRWQGTNVCRVSDFVPLTSMTNIYLTGKFKPTQGLLKGCQISAIGYYYNAYGCRYFNISTYKLACPSASVTAPHP